jgi:nicotine blue oxidoreductase
VTHEAKIVGVVLAAGGSTRMGSPKALATLDGETFVARAVRTLREGGCARVMVIVAEPHGHAIARALGDVEHVRAVWNPAPEDGQLGSLQVALRAMGDDTDAAVVALVDHPRVSSATVEALIRAHARARVEVARPRRAGRHGHPFLIDRALFFALLDADLRLGARPVLDAARTHASVEVDDDAIHDDVDTKDDARALGARPK